MNNQHRTVLVIGDSAQGGEPLAHLLEECGCHVLAEESVGRAIEAMSDFTRRERPSLILCDLNCLSDDPAMLGLLREETGVEVIGFGAEPTRVNQYSIRTVSQRPNTVAQMSQLVHRSLSRAAKAA